VNFDELRSAAREALQHSYSPYSSFPVGAAALVDDGRIVVGANIENASYGVTLCAECTLVGQLQMTGGGRLVAFACVDAVGNVLMPCGRCRQLLYEFGGPDLLVDSPRGVVPMTEVLPDAFGPHDLTDPARKAPQ
jgi:cytidine deaminase